MAGANEESTMLKFARLFTVATLLLMVSWGASGQTLVAYTEEWPPYNFQDGRDVKGISTDLFREACRTARLNCTVELVPWARAYRIVQNTASTVLFTTARKPDRETHFQWAGPILPRSTWIFVRRPVANAPAMREIQQMRFGVVRGEAAIDDLLGLGVAPPSIQEDSNNTSLLRLLTAGIIDAMVDTEVAMDWTLRSNSLPAETVQKHSKLTDQGAYFYAINRKTHPDVVARLQAALDLLRRQGRLDALVQRYTQR
jgi:polar amino acid transport system substrate-binding protein